LSRKHVPLAWSGKPISQLIDVLSARIGPFRLSQGPELFEKELSDKELLTCLSQLPASTSLRPIYDEYSLNWLVAVLREKKTLGNLRKVAVYGSKHELIGWYIYYLHAHAVSTVLHINAAPGRLDHVFRHLCRHAWQGDSIALTGRLEPQFTKEFSRNLCLLHWRSWMLAHSRNPSLLAAIDSGNAFFTALEGEWWISIEGEQPGGPAA
jgi:hypothetical protein